MDVGTLPSHLWAVILGWGLRAFFERPSIPEERPCICRCSCSCVSEGTGYSFLALVFILVLGLGLTAAWFFVKKETAGSASPKGRKGVFGVSGKVLSLTG